MGKKKLPKVSFPELEAMLEDMKELLTDEYGNPLPPDHPQVKKLQSLAELMEGNESFSPENEGGSPRTGHA